MPEKLRHGSGVVQDGDLQVYGTIFFLSMIGFYIWFWVMEKIFIFNDYFDKSFLKKSADDRYWRVQFLVLATHHVIVPICTTYVMYFSCSNPHGLPFPSMAGGSYSTPEQPRHNGWYKTDDCFFEVNKGHLMILSFTLGFLTFDTLKMLQCIEDKSKLIVK